MYLEKSNLFNRVIELLKQYLEQNTSETNVLNYFSGDELKSKLSLSLDSIGVDEDKIINEIEKYLEFSPRTSHPLFSNQLTGGFNLEAFIGEIVSFITNTTMATFEVAPVATLIEKELVRELSKKIGYENGSGIMLTGGSNANLMAIHCARNKKFPNTKKVGNPSKKLAIYVSKEAHYSFKKAVILMGLGTDSLVLVDTLSSGSMDPVDLEKKIKQTIQDGNEPLIICSTAGTTVLGAFDNIKENNNIAKKYDLWHHVDGAWGGPVVFSDKHSLLVDGLNQTDSFTFDAHKALSTGLITSFFILRNENELKDANTEGGESYLFHDYENSAYDTGALSLQCGRKVDALKFWLYWKAKGHKGISEEIENRFSLAIYLKDRILENSRLKLIQEPEYLNVCFQVIPVNGEEINEYNRKLRFKLMKEGKIMVNFSSFEDGTVFFRQVFANNLITKKDIDHFLDIILRSDIIN